MNGGRESWRNGTIPGATFDVTHEEVGSWEFPTTIFMLRQDCWQAFSQLLHCLYSD